MGKPLTSHCASTSSAATCEAIYGRARRKTPTTIHKSLEMKVVEYLLQTLEKNNVEVIFGNPGTTEIPLVRACERQKKIRYVVALSEVAAVPMADGYARAG